jgi:hypothetical protein
VGVEQAVDQMQVAGAATAGADRQLTGQMRLGTGGKGSGLFVAHVNPLNLFLTAQRVSKAIQRVTYHAKHAFDACLLQRFGNEISNRSGHGRGSLK